MKTLTLFKVGFILYLFLVLGNYLSSNSLYRFPQPNATHPSMKT